MYIKDLQLDIELDHSALATIRGGFYAGHSGTYWPADEPLSNGLPTFGRDWANFETEVLKSISIPQPDLTGYDPISLPGIPSWDDSVIQNPAVV